MLPMVTIKGGGFAPVDTDFSVMVYIPATKYNHQLIWHLPIKMLTLMNNRYLVAANYKNLCNLWLI